MTYRGDADAQRARIEELERKLEAAGAEVLVLRGETVGARPGKHVEHSRVSNGPSKYVQEVVVPHVIDEEGYEAIATVLRTRLSLNAIQVGRTLTVPGSFSLTREGESTRIRLAADWSSLRAGVIATSVMTGGLGSLMSFGLLADILTHGLGWHHTMAADTGIAAAAVPVGVGLTVVPGLLMRRVTARNSKKMLADHEGTFAAILSLADDHAVREVPPTRVAQRVEEEMEQEAESGAARSARQSS